MVNKIVIKTSDLPEWAKKCLYGYARNDKVKPMCYIVVTENVSLSGDNGEGHYFYNGVEVRGIKSGYSENLISEAKPQQILAFGTSAPLKQGQFYLNISHYYDGGERYYVSLFMNPADMPKELTEGNNDLSNDEKTLLMITASNKSSYAGISDYRAYEARKKGVKENIDEMRAKLREKGYLDKRNAITVKGKNVAINTRGY